MTSSNLTLPPEPHPHQPEAPCQQAPVTVSIVSHGHGAMVCRLIERLTSFPEVSKVVLIKNIPESLECPTSERLLIHENARPLGFGANHNQAFAQCDTDFFCVLNPDIQLPENPFPQLIASLGKRNAPAIVAPLILSTDGEIEDSARKFPTPWSILRKIAFGEKGSTPIETNKELQATDWAAGMFLVFAAPSYQKLHGFDEHYFLYYEDVDICWRARQLGHEVLVNTEAHAIHAAQRASHRNFRHFVWHTTSMLRFFTARLRSPQKTADT